jgi:cytochrome P450
MRNALTYEIDLETFWRDPYPDLKRMRARHPLVYVPQLSAALLTRRDDIFENEKKVELYSSVQPRGLMVRLMGQNMMRKDGDAHALERKAIFPTVSPKAVKEEWKQKFQAETTKILMEVRTLGRADLVKDIAMRACGEALKIVTGLTNISWQEMDRVSQGMIDGCANYAGDTVIEDRCNQCTAAIDRYINEMVPIYGRSPNNSLLSVQMQAGLPFEAIRANVKLAISGGQNEPRDVIAGMIWALLTHPEQFARVRNGEVSWFKVFEEYSRWISPVGMSPRRVSQTHSLYDATLEPNDRLFLMFGSANRDERVFEHPDAFDLSQSAARSIPFGAGPHFCAGAAVARCLVAEVVVPMIFEHLPELELSGETVFGGWAFRGPLTMPVSWRCQL